MMASWQACTSAKLVRVFPAYKHTISLKQPLIKRAQSPEPVCSYKLRRKIAEDVFLALKHCLNCKIRENTILLTIFLLNWTYGVSFHRKEKANLKYVLQSESINLVRLKWIL